MKTSVFSRVRSTSENLSVFITRDENLWYMYSVKKSKFSFYFIIYTPMCVSDVITNRQCVDVQCLACEALE